jgi:hypothetical protein
MDTRLTDRPRSIRTEYASCVTRGRKAPPACHTTVINSGYSLPRLGHITAARIYDLVDVDIAAAGEPDDSSFHNHGGDIASGAPAFVP